VAIKTFEVHNIDSLLDGVRKTFTSFEQAVVWFRGHSNADFKLQSTVHRKGIPPNVEHNLASMLIQKARLRYSSCPDQRDLAGWLSLMRHYGLATRLLDWTESPLNAAFFAVGYDDEVKGPADIWALSPCDLNKLFGKVERTMFDMSSPMVERVLGGAFYDCVAESVFAVHSAEIDMRMLLQQSRFTIHGLVTPLQELPEADQFLVRFIVPEAVRRHLSLELLFAGLRLSNIFPDLGNLAIDLERQLFGELIATPTALRTTID
jgi:FRG domain-containing protein